MGRAAEDEWAAEHFPGVPIITCMARDKHKHMKPGDVLVDDRENHRATYEALAFVSSITRMPGKP